MGELRDITANLTLGEIMQRCVDNFYLLSHDFVDYQADTLDQAAGLFSVLYQMGLRKLGVRALDLYERTIKANTKNLKDETVSNFYGNMLEKDLRRCGIKVEKLTYGQGYRMNKGADRLEKGGNPELAQIIREKARLEPDQSPEDMARSGMYIFKGKWDSKESENDYFIYDEIAYFISEPIVLDASRLATQVIVLPGQVKYLIRSNIRI